MKTFEILLLILSLTPVNAQMEPFQRLIDRDILEDVEGYLSSRSLDPSHNEFWSRELQEQDWQEVGSIVRRGDKFENIKGLKNKDWFMAKCCFGLFAEAADLENHLGNCPRLRPPWLKEKPHIDGRRIVCPHCGSWYEDPNNYTSHLFRAHGNEMKHGNEQPQSRKTLEEFYMCRGCGRLYGSQERLEQNHVDCKFVPKEAKNTEEAYRTVPVTIHLSGHERMDCFRCGPGTTTGKELLCTSFNRHITFSHHDVSYWPESDAQAKRMRDSSSRHRNNREG